MGVIQKLDFSPLWLSLKTGVAATVISFFLGIFIADLSMKLKKSGRAVLDGFLTLPLVLPPTATGFFLLCLFGIKIKETGISIEIEPGMIQSWKGCLVAAAVIAFPLMYRNARDSFSCVDEKLLYAARTLGMSEFRIFWKIVLPASVKGIAAGTVLTFIRATGEYGATSMLVENIAGKTTTLSLAIASETAAGNIGIAGYWSIWIALLTWIILILFNIVTGRGMKARRWI